MGHICALLLSGSDIRFLGTTGPEPEPDSKKWPDIRPSGTRTGYPVHPYKNYIIFTRLPLRNDKNRNAITRDQRVKGHRSSVQWTIRVGAISSDPLPALL